MIRIRQVLRLMYINWVLVRHGLDEVILTTHLFRPIRFVRYLIPWLWIRKTTPRGQRIRLALQDLGPIFVKFGQILSTRRDLLADDIADELAQLQDKVLPFPSHIAHTIIRQAYRQEVTDIFQQLDAEPFAAASIAQVYGAHLHDGQAVIVKVLRPNIERVIKRDIGLMYIIAYLAERYWKHGKRLRPREVVQEFEKTIFDELDLVREAANASQLRRNFLHSKALYIPEVVWPYTRQNVMVMERIFGTPVGQIEELKRQGIDLKVLGERGVDIFFTQVFRDNFFHADMHPGNIFVAPDGQYIAVDFGIVGTLNSSDKQYLAENFLAFFNRDYRRVAELHVASGWVPASTRIDEFESAIRTVCEPIFEKPLRDISFGHFLLRLFQTARRFDMEVQPQLVLLQKTFLNIEGLGRQLYPDLDLWSTAKPFLEQWMKQQIGPRAFLDKLKLEAATWAEMMPELPRLYHEFLKQGARQDREPQAKHQLALRQDLQRYHRSSVLAVVGGALLVTAGVTLPVHTTFAWFDGLPLVSLLLGSLAGVCLLMACKRE